MRLFIFISFNLIIKYFYSICYVKGVIELDIYYVEFFGNIYWGIVWVVKVIFGGFCEGVLY